MRRNECLVLMLCALAMVTAGCAHPRLIAYPPYCVEGAITLDRVDRETLTPEVLQSIVTAHHKRAPSGAAACYFDPWGGKASVSADVTDDGLIAVYLSEDQVGDLLGGRAQLVIECSRSGRSYEREFSLDGFVLGPKDVWLMRGGNAIFLFGGWKVVDRDTPDPRRTSARKNDSTEDGKN